jgi:predicted secreted protein
MTSTASVELNKPNVSLPAVAAVAICVFLVVLTFLAFNLRSGHDPALGTAASAPAAQKLIAPAKAQPVSAPVTRSSGG